MISGLKDGGAEALLYRLASSDLGNDHHVISLSEGGKYLPLLKSCNVPVHVCPINSLRCLESISAIIDLMKTLSPDVVQTWMYHADFVGGILARLTGFDNVVWSLHNSKLFFGKSRVTTILMVRMLSKLSFFIPKKIISCSQVSIDVHVEKGYAANKFVWIPNGIDTAKFKSSSRVKESLRRYYSLRDSEFVIGCVGRFSPEKDHKNLTRALGLLKAREKPFKAFFVGDSVNIHNAVLMSAIEKAQISLNREIFLLGSVLDVSKILPLIDVLVMPSSSEAFPLAVCEAMASEIPCVVTDVGDSARIVRDTGWVGSPNNSEELADAIESAYISFRSSSWRYRCRASRDVIVSNYSFAMYLASHNRVWESL